jgi:crossover junction endodeoxyribonuclease RuvC
MNYPILRVMGVDPGLVTTGYGVIESQGQGVLLLEGGVVSGGPPDGPLGDRLLAIFQGIGEVIEEYRPGALALEDLYSYHVHPATVILMAHARGVICLAAAQARIPVFSYPASRIKSYLVGSGRASKAQIQRAVQKRLSLDEVPSPHDVADALAAALCHCQVAGRGSLTASLSQRA